MNCSERQGRPTRRPTSPTGSTRPVCDLPAKKMLTLVAILAGPIVLTTIVMIAIFEIKDAWDRNRLR